MVDPVDQSNASSARSVSEGPAKYAVETLHDQGFVTADGAYHTALISLR
jgi:hypothetical protein